MINQIKIIVWWLIPLVLIFDLNVCQENSQIKKVNHTVLIYHPGEKAAVETILTEVQNKVGLPIEYYMNVKSVICLAEVCKVIPVTLYWDNIGNYKKYQIEEGATLEKYEADAFELKDYEKLHNILKDKYSPFRDVFIEDIWTVPNTAKVDVDAISGATILELDEKDTVPGAALTCYTLWHWANGNVVSVINTKTGQSASNFQLKDFIDNESAIYFKIALNELEQRDIYDVSFINAIIQRVLEDEFLLKEALTYMEKASSKNYLTALSELFFKGGKEQKLAAIRSLKYSKVKIPKPYLDSLSKEFNQLESFQEVSVLINLMEIKNPKSSIVINNMMSLLDSDILISRRAYWFLRKQELNPKQEKKLKKYERQNNDKL